LGLDKQVFDRFFVEDEVCFLHSILLTEQCF
jgi:hypothetical protein